MMTNLHESSSSTIGRQLAGGLRRLANYLDPTGAGPRLIPLYPTDQLPSLREVGVGRVLPVAASELRTRWQVAALGIEKEARLWLVELVSWGKGGDQLTIISKGRGQFAHRFALTDIYPLLHELSVRYHYRLVASDGYIVGAGSVYHEEAVRLLALAGHLARPGDVVAYRHPLQIAGA